MAVVLEQLLSALDDLGTDKLKRFKWRLKNYYGVSAADLENADAPDTVDLMMKRFGPEEAVKTTVKILRKMNYNHLAEELEKLGNIDLWTRKDFLQYSLQLTLDLNTMNKNLRLSENNRKIFHTNKNLSYPDHPDSFDGWCHQVLCRESVCGRCYWEIEWRGDNDVRISVSYKSISRKGSGYECGFGFNDQSWSLYCRPSSYSFWHNNIKTDLPVEPIISRIEVNDVRTAGVNEDVYRVGVYVDHGAGTLFFYSVSDTMSLIHTVHTTFTQTLYPGFGFGTYRARSSILLCC